MRVLHLGNLVNNGYNNAKLLRRVGVAADVVCDETHIMSQPEWEDSDVEAPDNHYSAPFPAPGADPWERPEWVIPLVDPIERRRFKGHYWLEFRWTLLRNAPRITALHRALRDAYEPLRGVLGTELTVKDVAWGLRISWFQRLILGRPLEPFLRSYDVIQAYAAHPVIPLVTVPSQPYVAFEHGTLREIPFENTPRGRLMSVAYRLATRVIVTNPDVIGSVRRLELDNFVFVPHPVDETKYTPGESSLRLSLEREGARFVLLSPARHDWHEKGNEMVIEAVAALIREGHEGALLLLTEWGEDVGRSKSLIRDLGLETHVRWYPPLSKARLLDAYRAADAVLDQFVIGTFGGITPEAMACGRPVVMAFDRSLHEWCFPELPPVLAARSAGEIHSHLRRLLEDPAERERVGKAGRAWIENHHGWQLVVDRQLAVYQEVLAEAERRRMGAGTALSV